MNREPTEFTYWDIFWMCAGLALMCILATWKWIALALIATALTMLALEHAPVDEGAKPYRPTLLNNNGEE